MRPVLGIILALVTALDCPAQAGGETLDSLRAVLMDGEAKPRARREAATTIGELGSAAAAACLVEAIDHVKDESVRAGIVHALALSPRGAGVEDLLLELAGELSDRTVCAAAVAHVWELSIDWRDWYRRFLRRKDTRRYHAAAIRAVAAGGCEGSREFLKALCLEERGALGAYAIRYAVEVYGVADAWDEFVAPYLIPVTDGTMRDAAIAALGRGKDPCFVAKLEKFTDVEQRRKQAATWIPLLAGIGNRKALAVIVEIVREPTAAAIDAFFAAGRRMRDPAVLEWFRSHGAKHESEVVRHVSVISMGAHPDRRNVGRLARIADRDADEVAAAAVVALSRHDRADCEKALRKLMRHRDPQRAADAMESWYGACGGDGAFVAELVFHAGESRSWHTRVAALRLLREKHTSAARPVMLKNARHRNDEVRIAAYEALTWSRTRETVDFLVEALDREKGRPLVHLIAALTNLTGTQWGDRIARWREWWPRVREGFELPPRGDGLKLAASDSRYGFYGIGADSKAVVFVVDVSGSMSRRASTGTATRIVRAKSELIAAVRKFGPDHRFNVIVFNGRPRAYAPTLVECTPEERAKFEKWVNALRPGGSTNLHDSLAMALDIADVDTIFLLADGGANAGRVTDTRAILDTVRRRNRFRRITINAIGIGVAAGVREFIRDLAAQNWGTSALL